MEAAIVGALVAGVVAVFAFLIRKWTGGLEDKVKELDAKKVDEKLCVKTHDALCQKFDMFKATLEEVRLDVKDLSKSMSTIAKRGE